MNELFEMSSEVLEEVLLASINELNNLLQNPYPSDAVKQSIRELQHEIENLEYVYFSKELTMFG